jgi:5-methylcytosine-specific restriction endonuclease McrA
MYISKKDRELIKQKFNGLCAYSGTVLEDDWQVDHIKPLLRGKGKYKMLFEDRDHIENMIPCQKIINHYKRSLDIETFRSWYLGELHLRLSKLPKNPRTEKTKKRIEYLRKVASYFNITEDKPFNKKFYFETIENENTDNW